MPPSLEIATQPMMAKRDWESPMSVKHMAAGHPVRVGSHMLGISAWPLTSRHFLRGAFSQH
jgi:hypothetical protein